MTTVTLKSATCAAKIKLKGAELCSLRTNSGDEYVWQADPAVWPRHAPLLFPVVGKLKDDTLLHDDKAYPMKQHGFVRDMDFTLAEQTSSRASFRLDDSPATRAQFPFEFSLVVSYTLQEQTLDIDCLVRNPTGTPLPISIGGHPGFAWPLPGNKTKAGHSIVFETNEPAPIRRVKGGLMDNKTFPTPVSGNTLPLADELFAPDVIIFDQLKSRSVVYQGPAGARLRITFPDFPHLGLWTKPGAPFICIEPWQGYASPESFDGEFEDKPGVAQIAPYSERTWRHSVILEPR